MNRHFQSSMMNSYHSIRRNTSLIKNPEKSSIYHPVPQLFLKNLQQNISITCQLCNDDITDPIICPKCNQIFCTQCLKNYLSQIIQACPICHQSMSFNQFQWYECQGLLIFLKEQLRNMSIIKKQADYKIYQVQSQKFNQLQNSGSQKCQQHSLPMRYYCEDCSKPVCSDCGMISSIHRNHKFIHLNDIYIKIKQKLNGELCRLNNKIFESEEHNLKIKKHLHKLEIEHLHIKRYTEEYYLLLVGKFEDQITAKTICLKQIQEKNSKQIEFYQSCRDSICEEIQKKTKNQLINQAEKLSMSFAMVVCEPPQLIKVQESFQTIKQLTPEYNHFTYVLNNYSSCTARIIYSNVYVLNGSEWKIKIYPKGNGVAEYKYLSVFVQMTKADVNQKKFEYKIQLLNKNPQIQSVKREYCSSFDIGQCWGYNQFILLEQLQSSGYLYDNKLHFIMGIRNPDYRTLANDHSNYIKSLEAQIKLKEFERINCIQERNIIDEFQNDNSSYSQNKILKLFQLNSFEDKKQKKIKKQKQKQRKNLHSQSNQEKLTVQLLNELCQKQQTPQNSFKYHYKSSKIFSNQESMSIDEEISQKFLMTNDFKIKQNQRISKKELKIIRKPKLNQKKQTQLKCSNHKDIIRQIENQERTLEQITFEPKLKFSQKQKVAEFSMKNKNKNIKKERSKEKFYESYEQKQEKIQEKLNIETKETQFRLFQQNKSQIKEKRQESINSALKEKKHLISKKEVSKKMPVFHNNKIEEEEKRQKKLFNILQNSKRLSVVTYENDYLSNQYGYKQAETLPHIKNSTKNLYSLNLAHGINGQQNFCQQQEQFFQRMKIKKGNSNEQNYHYRE